jgi:hypothetical protein
MLGNISMDQLRGLARAGRIRAFRVSRKTLVLRVADIEAYMASCEIRPAQQSA